MGLGWIITDNSDNVITEFLASAKDLASSTKAEALAVLSALVCAPQGSSVQLVTDSQACIDGFNKACSNTMTPRRFLKLKNYMIWTAIIQVISKKGLKIQWTKVKAHDNIKLNIKADLLAKEETRLDLFLAATNRSTSGAKYTLKWNDGNQPLTLDMSVRQVFKVVQQNKYYDRMLHHENMTYRYLHNALTDAKLSKFWTKKWIGFNPFELSTSVLLSRLIGKKIKWITSTLPTLDRLHRNFPRLIPASMKCQRCNNWLDTDHLWKCEDSKVHIYNGLRNLRSDLIEILNKTPRVNLDYNMENTVDASNLFPKDIDNLDANTDIRQGSPIHLLCNNLIPICLIVIFKSCKVSLDKNQSVFMDALYRFHKHLHVNIWKLRAHLFKLWKEDNDITKSDFKNYRTNQRSNWKLMIDCMSNVRIPF